MTEFGKTPFYTATEFEQMGYKMVIWPVSSLRAPPTRRRKSSTPRSRPTAGRTNTSIACRPRQELYDTIGLHQFEELDASIIKTIVPQGMPQVG